MAKTRDELLQEVRGLGDVVTAEKAEVQEKFTALETEIEALKDQLDAQDLEPVFAALAELKGSIGGISDSDAAPEPTG